MAKNNSMVLYYETITPLLKSILHEIMQEPLFNQFFLAGGTSLSLRLGHRRSIDIYLFTNAPYGSLDFTKYENFFQTKYNYYDCLDKTDLVAFGRSYYIGVSEEESIKVDMFYHDGIIDPCDTLDGIRMVSLPDVIAMKVDVVLRGGRKKDFWDLHELMNGYSIPEMVELHKQRYEYAHDRTQIIHNLVDFTLADKDLDPICLKGKQWELIKLDFVEWMEQNL